MAESEGALPYAWPFAGWPPAGDLSYRPADPLAAIRLQDQALRSVLAAGPLQYFFAFVAADDGVAAEGGETPDPAVWSLIRQRGKPADGAPLRQVMLDMIRAEHFLERAARIDPCPPNDPIAAQVRRDQLLTTELLAPPFLRVAMLLLSAADPLEAGYLANLLPSTWHRVVIGLEFGLPVLLAPDFEMDEFEAARLVYAAPATFTEAASLDEIISLNHVPDAGA